jgi:hypothetical protein
MDFGKNIFYTPPPISQNIGVVKYLKCCLLGRSGCHSPAPSPGWMRPWQTSPSTFIPPVLVSGSLLNVMLYGTQVKWRGWGGGKLFKMVADRVWVRSLLKSQKNLISLSTDYIYSGIGKEWIFYCVLFIYKHWEKYFPIIRFYSALYYFLYFFYYSSLHLIILDSIMYIVWKCLFTLMFVESDGSDERNLLRCIYLLQVSLPFFQLFMWPQAFYTNVHFWHNSGL